jgi:hypothetical protein
MADRNQFECPICITSIWRQDNIITCSSCNYRNCTGCHKEYLLTTSNEPHCMNCRTVIPYAKVLDQFGSWIFGKYKKHRENLLFNKESSLMPATVNKYSTDKKIEVLKEKKKELRLQIQNIEIEIWGLKNPAPIEQVETKKNGFKYIYRCPLEDCKGFLDKDAICQICDNLICTKCYTEMDKDHVDEHECNEDLVQTFNEIKRDSKPCPSCGFFISKVNGCDQMFCVSCGTPFSWRTGAIEQGIIHNPHAYNYFQNNPEAQRNYLNGINQAARADGCRTFIPNIMQFKPTFIGRKEILEAIHTATAEFRQYRRNRYQNYINRDPEENNDLRLRYIHNEINEKKFKELIHARDKKIKYSKEVSRVIISAYDTFEILLWAIVDNQPNDEPLSYVEETKVKNQLSNILDILINTRTSVNSDLMKVSHSFHYSSYYSIEEDYRAPYLSGIW